ncbi:alpha/beta hydrolase [Streptomyces albiaxialis]|uniref:Alpha/beta hydrolase n=1 Tax=Streptomyces albiaxialis TaxID=329523 RepID=A0ABP5HI65_9ACTN
MSTPRRRAGLAGAALGVVAAGVALERLTVHRAVRRKARLALDAEGPYGTLRGTEGAAVAEDGTELYYETDEPEPGGEELPFTVVFSHGYCLNQDVWHFQRAALRERGDVRAVYWDQRGHGRSGRGPAGGEISIDLLGRDLRAVLDAAVPEGPVVLVGHSMGGMTTMAFAAQYPDEAEGRVAGVALLGTSAGGLADVTYGLPSVGVKAVRRVVPGVLRALVKQTELVERGRRATADLFAGLVRRYSFGAARDVDAGVARFAEKLIESVPVDVVAEFYPAFAAHEKTAALAAFDGVPALVLAGDRDLLTPLEHSERIAAALPAAELVVLEETGHLLMLERPEAVAESMSDLLARILRAYGSTAPPVQPDRPHGRPDAGAGRAPRQAAARRRSRPADG